MLDRTSLFAEVDRHFTAAESIRRVGVFGRRGRQVDGWFKGEMMCLLDGLVAEKQIGGWRADAAISEDGRRRCDFRVDLEGGPLWVETRALVQRTESGGRVDPGVYLSRGGPADMTEDIVKLMRIPEGEPAVVLFVYPRPEEAVWREVLDTYRRRIAPIGIEEQTQVGDYPAELYICKLALEGGF